MNYVSASNWGVFFKEKEGNLPVSRRRGNIEWHTRKNCGTHGNHWLQSGLVVPTEAVLL